MTKMRSRFAAVLCTIALAAGGAVALAGAAGASGFTDTSLQASGGFTTSSLSLADPTVLLPGATSVTIGVFGHANGGLSFTGSPVVAASADLPSGVTIGAPADFSSGGTTSFAVSGLADGQDFSITARSAPSPSHNITDQATVRIVKDSSGDVALIFDQATVNVPPDTVYPNVQFTGKSNFTCVSDEAIFLSTSCAFTETSGDFDTPVGGLHSSTGTAPLDHWFPANIPAGLTLDNGNPGVLHPGTAVPDTYAWATVLGAEFDNGPGSAAQGSLSFTLTVQGQPAASPPGDLGNFVNPYGNGFDVYQQHYAVNTIVAGWTATKFDPATLFVRTLNSHGGFSLEAVNGKGIATGLCVSDPVGSEPAGFVPGQLTLRGCNNSAFQGFSPQPDSSLQSDVAGAGHVEPNGTGAPLVVKTTFDPWNGFKYQWKDRASLPG